MNCPVSSQDVVGAMLRGEFKEMNDADFDGLAGVEYDGFTAELNGCTVVADHGPGGIEINVIHTDPDSWHQIVWRLHIDYADGMEQIV